MSKEIILTLIKSHIGRPKKHRDVLNGLGLNRMHKKVVLQDTPEVRGMINKICHMVSVQE